MKARNHGAALVIALLIMTVLLLIGLTFFSVTRIEVHTSENLLHSIRAGFLADAATAIAMQFLNYDFVIHSMYTSTDHAWRTYFNGAWAAGKWWTWVEDPVWARANDLPENTRRPLTHGGVPEVNLDISPAIGDWLYVPRIQPPNRQGGPLAFDKPDEELNPDLRAREGANPRRWGDWTTTQTYDYSPLATQLTAMGLPTPQGRDMPPLEHAVKLWPEEQVHYFSDVDNDGDGLNDSIWLPIGSDQFLTDDGIDNNLNGLIDEPGEACVFVYWGGNDGLDNNGDGLIDDESEQRIFLTAPIRSPFGPDKDPDYTFPVSADGYLEPFQVFRRDPDSEDPDQGRWYWVDPRPGSPTVDVLDNDWDLLVNDHEEYFPLLEGHPRYSNPGHYGDEFGLAGTAHRIAQSYLAGMGQIY
ncbi:MAG TPA: hypothetical protein ENN80_11905, partial [Candidatus Hydrogenedentes bacterium]|nr:hypothetical protein [Candidatus Hydrogenedentota bacterium]